QRQQKRQVNHDIDGKESPYRLDHPAGNQCLSQLDLDDGVGVNEPLDLPQPLLEDQQDADDLHAPAGGPGTGPDNGGIYQQIGKDGGPGTEIGGGETGGGGDG